MNIKPSQHKEDAPLSPPQKKQTKRETHKGLLLTNRKAKNKQKEKQNENDSEETTAT